MNSLIGEKEAKTLVEYIGTKVEKKFEEKRTGMSLRHDRIVCDFTLFVYKDINKY